MSMFETSNKEKHGREPQSRGRYLRDEHWLCSSMSMVYEHRGASK